MGTTTLNADGVKALATLPSLDELRARLVGMISTPATRIAQIVNAPAAQLARVIRRLRPEGRGGMRPFLAVIQHTFEPNEGITTMADLAKIVDDLSTLTVLEAAELSKLLEEKWGVSAAAPVAVAAAGGGAAAAAPVEEKTEFDVILDRRRRQEDQRHQGSPRDHRSRPQGSQGPGRRRSEGRSRKRFQGRSRQVQGPAGSSRRQGRTEVNVAFRRAASAVRRSLAAGDARVRVHRVGEPLS